MVTGVMEAHSCPRGLILGPGWYKRNISLEPPEDIMQSLTLDLEFNWKDDPSMDHEIWGLSLPSFTLEP